MKIPCKIIPSQTVNQNGKPVKSVIVECTLCGKQAEIWGRSENSIKKGFFQLSTNCNQGRRNLYCVEQKLETDDDIFEY